MSSSSASSASSSPFIPARQSVRDLLAELSDSEPDVSTKVPSRTESFAPKSRAAEEESSEDDILLNRGGKLARRLAGEAVKPVSDSSVTIQDGERHDRVSEELTPGEQRFQPTRKLLLKRKVTKTPERSRIMDHAASKSLSPAASPFSNRSDNSSASTTRPMPALTQKLTEVAESNSKSRFSALVEKARRQRLAREEEERAKKEAVRTQESLLATEQRKESSGGLIADSDNDSDVSDAAAAKRLTKTTRPTRKASKKALEEMNRETQRMNRNMQLAHQAKTKKKFTKESFFASFTHDLSAMGTAQPQKNRTSSPESLSDDSITQGEKSGHHSTPPTSPLLDPEESKQRDSQTAAFTSAPASTTTKEHSELFLPIEEVQQTSQVLDRTTKQLVMKQTAKMTVARAVYDLSSDSDLEVIVDQASKRKYSAFENLPKKKSKEKPSHLALRSLANVRYEKSAKSSMKSAEMGPALLRAARKQALDERQAKIERLKAAGVVIQTVEEREKEEEELEDLVEKARQEDEEIRKREKQIAKKNGTFQKDILDEDESDEDDEDFDDQNTDEEDATSGSEDEAKTNELDEAENVQDVDDNRMKGDLIDNAAEESATVSDDDKSDDSVPESEHLAITETPILTRTHRRKRVIDDDEDELEADQTSRNPFLPTVRRTPHSIMRSARKAIPGLQFSDDLPIGLTQAFAATMAESQTQGDVPHEHQGTDVLSGLPSPNLDMVPQLQRLDSIDIIAESVSGTQNQLLGLNLDLSQQQRVLESPGPTLQPTASQPLFELTQDMGYKFSPFAGNRYVETPGRQPHSTEETIILGEAENSPILQRQGRLRRGRQVSQEEATQPVVPESAFAVMSKAAKRRVADDFNRKRSEARQAVDEAAEESDDEYAGLGGASGEDSDEEANEDDRKMIDEDTQVGRGDEAKLAKLHADRERESDEAAVSKLLKDITSGALRRKRGPGDDLELSDEEDNAAQRRKAKQREFEKMRRALLKDEAIGKIAEDKRKEAFLKSIEDRDDDADESDNDYTGLESQQESGPQMLVDVGESGRECESHEASQKTAQPLQPSKDSQLNKLNSNGRRSRTFTSRKPATLAEIRESVSFLVEEPDSQAQIIDLGLSESEEEPEAYINLDRHLQQAEADENAEDDDAEDFGDFIVDDQPSESGSQHDIFKKPDLPRSQQGDRAPFSERRTKAANVVDRLSLLRQASSSTGTSNASSRMAFFASKAVPGGPNGGPSLLRRATTNSSLGSLSGRDNVSATGVVTSKTERGSAKEEKEFVRKGNTTSRNAVNYQGRQNLKEEKMSARAGVNKRQQKKGGSGFLSGLLRSDTWG